MLTGHDFKRILPPIIRSGVMGTFVGVLPGSGATTGSMVGYAMQKKFKSEEPMGTGAIEGIAASEAAVKAANKAYESRLRELKAANEPQAERYYGVCWRCAYRLFNCFGASVHGPMYYAPWQHRWNTQEPAIEHGDVNLDGAISVADVVCVMNNILGIENETFDFNQAASKRTQLQT